MQRFLAALVTVLFSSSLLAAPEYVSIEMEIAINKPAAEVWAKVGDYQV